MNTQSLRLAGYSVNTDGHIDCHAAGVKDKFRMGAEHPRPRFVQEHLAVIRIDIVEGDRRAASELIEQLVAAADSPRALVGTSRTGCVMLFRHEQGTEILPQLPGHVGDVFELATVGGTVRFTVTIASEKQIVDVSAHNWGKRSPEQVERDRLPVLTHDVGQLVLDAAFKVGTWSSFVKSAAEREAHEQRVEEFKAKVARGDIETDAERMAREDAALVAAHAGRDLVPSDGTFATLVIAARRRLARRANA